MTRLSSAFGEKYQSNALRTKSFELAGHTFKVRIPLSKEMDEIQERINKINQDEAKARFEKMTSSFRENPVEGIVVTDDDVVVEGRSTKELVNTILTVETRIVEYVKLLVPEAGDFDNLTYEEIEAEWPMSVQLELLSCISEAIQPGYKDSRKN
ncbi:hypothetical protein UFOVP164_56 [uncultured Caudovirales phage]|uniref:Uncharacterized protein n=1 Tax=uncultured Caudovirales phage TaxID=2100421 RepID=A0A6J7XP53_9CAUD|nr:hypothetical protein UFOVP164_56 [uncultured Caudovirales phage]